MEKMKPNRLEDSGIADIFDAELKSERETKFYSEVSQVLVEISNQFQPPYTFELPPTDQRMKPDYPGYKYYMCRTNNIQTSISGLDHLLMWYKHLMTPEEIEKLESAKQVIMSAEFESHGNIRTKEDMQLIKSSIEHAVHVLKDIQLSLRETKKDAA